MNFRNYFFHIFPTPRFLLMSAAGLDISDNSIHFVELERNAGKLVLKKYGEKEIPSGAIVSGEIKNAQVVSDVIAKIKKEYDLRFVHVSLPEQYGYSFKVTLPHLRKKEVRSGIELQLEENIPLSNKNTIFDYTTTSCLQKNDKNELNFGVVAASRKIVSQYFSLISRSGLTPLSFELEGQALARSIIKKEDCNTFMIVDMGATRTGINIVSEGIIQFTSTVNIGGLALTKIVAKAFDMNMKEAKEFKERHGLVKKYNNKDIFDLLTPVVSTLRDEINRHYIYWRTHKDIVDISSNKKIRKIILSGGEANVLGIKDYFSKTLDVDIELANPWTNITSLDDYIPQLSFEDSLRYATALGLSLRSF